MSESPADHPRYARKFLAEGWHAGFKPDRALPDFGFIYSLIPCRGWALFTRSSLPSHAVTIGRRHAALGRLRAAIVNSGNANVANGPEGETLVQESCRIAAASAGIAPEEVLPASTGIIGRRMPTGILEQACREIKERIKERVANSDDFGRPRFEDFAQAIRTTDAFPKIISRELPSGIRITAVAKGAGMIAPNMATMLVYICTDAVISAQAGPQLLSSVVERSFNRISVDGDTSTSDTATLLANGASSVEVRFPPAAAKAWSHLAVFDLLPSLFPGRAVAALSTADLRERLGLDLASAQFLRALFDICVELSCMIARDGEGASRMIELHVGEARSSKQALAVARSVIDSPLIKSALGAALPRVELIWGRLLMAIGKAGIDSADPLPLDLERLRIYIGGRPISVAAPLASNIPEELLKKEEISIQILLGLGNCSETVWGSSLTEDYVRLNSAYIT